MVCQMLMEFVFKYEDETFISTPIKLDAIIADDIDIFSTP